MKFKFMLFLLLNIVIVIIIIFLLGSYDWTGISNGFFLSGALLFSISGLRLIIRSGVYDFASFGISKFVRSIKYEDQKMVRDFYSYKDKKQTLRKQKPFNSSSYFIVGLLFVIISYFISLIALYNLS